MWIYVTPLKVRKRGGPGARISAPKGRFVSDDVICFPLPNDRNQSAVDHQGSELNRDRAAVAVIRQGRGTRGYDSPPDN